MIYLVLSAAVALFAVCFHQLRLVPVTKGIIAGTHDAVGVLRSTTLSDRDKETAIQRAAIRTTTSFISLLLRTMAACIVPVMFVWVFIPLGLFSAEEVWQGTTNVYFIVVSVLAMVALVFRK